MRHPRTPRGEGEGVLAVTLHYIIVFIYNISLDRFFASNFEVVKVLPEI